MSLPRFITVLGTAVVFSASLSAQSCPTSVQIVSPGDGEVVSSQQNVLIEATVTPPISPVFSNPVTVTAKVTVAGPGGTTTLANGDLQESASPDRLGTQWNLNSVASGNYTITLQVTGISSTGPCAPVEASVSVVVNRAPVLDNLYIRACNVTPSGTAITFEPITSDEEGDSMAFFQWNPGDGSPTQITPGSSPDFTYTYAPATGEVVLWVSGSDSRGGLFLDSRNLNVAACAFVAAAPPQDCGCDSMTVTSRAGNMTNIYCAAAVPRPDLGCAAVARPPAGACPALQTAFQCPLGPISTPGLLPAPGQDVLRWGFEVVANLNRASNNPRMCQEGQFNKGTVAIIAVPPGMAIAVGVQQPNPPAQPMPAAGRYMFPGGGDFTVVTGPNRYPTFAAPPLANGSIPFGADDYTEPFEFKRERDGEIGPAGTGFRQWFDAPGFTARINTVNAIVQADEFVSFVRSTGALGTCWCQFRVQHQWVMGVGRQAIGGGAAPVVVQMVAGRNCNIP